MKKIVFMLLVALLILSTFASGCGGPCRGYRAPIEDVAIWADNSSPPQYFVDVVSGCFLCDSYSGRYEVARVGHTTIEVEIFNGTCEIPCPPDSIPDSYLAQNISLGSDFFTGGNYTVVVNNVTETFVA